MKREGMKIRAVICDLDGTLLDTLEDLADSVNAMLAEQGFPVHPTGAYRYFVGDGAAVLVSRVLPEEHRDESIQKVCLRRFREEYAVRWKNKTRPYGGVLPTLATIQKLGIKLAVLSNKPQDATELCVRELLPGIRFDAVMGQTDGRPSKPDPAGALTIAEQLGVMPQEVLYLGDTATDMKTAVAAGMYPVGVLWGFRTADELKAHGAKILIARPEDVVALLNGGAWA
jgi:phosphoglycolate phosphatase